MFLVLIQIIIEKLLKMPSISPSVELHKKIKAKRRKFLAITLIKRNCIVILFIHRLKYQMVKMQKRKLVLVNTLPLCEEKLDNTVVSDDTDEQYCISTVDNKSIKEKLI